MTIRQRVKELIKELKTTNINKLFFAYLQKYHSIGVDVNVEKVENVASIIRAIYKCRKKVKILQMPKGLDELRELKLNDFIEFNKKSNKKLNYKRAHRFVGLYKDEYDEFIKLNKNYLKEVGLL